MTTIPRADGLRVLFAGGGTGGHLMPGAATARALQELVPGAASLFQMTHRSAERSCLPALAGCRTARMGDLRWAGPAGKVLWPARAGAALSRTLDVLRGFRPHVVVGLGGVNSVLPVLVARTLGMRTAVLESNALPGRAVRALAPVCDCVLLHWPQAAAGLRARRTVLTGSPVRPEVLAGDRRAARRRLGLCPLRPTLLAMGGSQGALALNEALLSALGLVRAGGADVQVLHLTGAGLLNGTRERAARMGLTGYRAVGFMERMADAYAAADVVLARAGGSTLAELTALGLPAILVPYPYATDGHQVANAEAAAAAGAAVVIPQSALTAQSLADAILALVRDDARRGRMAACARRIGRPRAARAAALHLAALAGVAPQARPIRPSDDTTIHRPLIAA
ncbi:MAG: UDP-N-acetylglucosamine--N-acetylmuramyl-(pentapeptide) pyrophosphoryl-undecaprenol N-acetylglucosamine transferase [Candidatus Brocadiaceae bacterium]|nr:UDP-N-acetylglucosamine--N-acetylmuramyl-(pentapeptide) pyrophosphoryl-undecaprenol N-acetylglucosamine transferase [Candidatus Brocadiaceae bacterium]